MSEDVMRVGPAVNERLSAAHRDGLVQYHAGL